VKSRLEILGDEIYGFEIHEAGTGNWEKLKVKIQKKGKW
jgi:hypothetical protein